VLQLSAHIQYPINERIRSALRTGSRWLSIWSDHQPRRPLVRTPRCWRLTLRRELTYHAVTDRYVLRDEREEQESFPDAGGGARSELGRIEDLPILVQSQLRGEGRGRSAVRAGVRRGRMPDALRALVFWTDDWHRTSDWYTWTLTL
jgi:hypothetical protein